MEETISVSWQSEQDCGSESCTIQITCGETRAEIHSARQDGGRCSVDEDEEPQELENKMGDYSKDELRRMLRDLIAHRAPTSDMEVIFRAGVRPDDSIREGLRPLHYAAYEPYLTCVQFLIRQGADVNASDDIGYTPLHIAAKHGHLGVANTLIKSGAAVNFDDDGCSGSELSKVLSSLTVNPLSLALENDQPEVAQLLLDNGANPNTRYFLGHEINMIPLENTRCLEVLLKGGADPNSFNRSGLTALMKACKFKQVEAVKVLLAHGADVNITCPPRFDERSALHFAAISGDPATIRLLLEAGANTKLTAEYPNAPLEEAICVGKLEGVKVFLEFGADPNEINSDGASLLQTAVSSIGLKCQKDIIEVLLQHGADPNYHRPTFSYVGPSLAPLIEYFTYMDEDYDISVVKLFAMYGAKVNLTRPTKLLKIGDPYGILGQIRKLRPHEDIFNFLLEMARRFGTDVIEIESSLSNKQREILLEYAKAPRDLKHLARLYIRDTLRLPVPRHVEQLPLPPFLKNYLLFNV